MITLIDGTVYNLPMGGFNVVFTLTDDAKAALKAGDAAEVAYSIAGAAETDEVVVRVLAASNCEAVVLADKQVVKVTPDALGEGYVDIYAINNTTGDIKAKTISFSAHTCEVAATSFLVSPKGGNVEVPVATSVDFEVEVDGSWLTYVETKAVATETVVLSAAENTTGKTNEATVTVKVDGKVVATFAVTQKSYEPKLLGEYLETYSQYGQPLTGTLKIEFTDDLSKGTYKVTICGTTLYADYEAGKLNCYDGKYTRTLTVASDFTKFEISNLSLGYTSYSDYVAILPLGPAELTEAEQALVGVYNEAWTHPNQQPAGNGMEITASEEASFGQLKVKFFTTTDGSSFTAYAALEDSKLKVAVGGMNHPGFGTIWDPAAVIEFTVNADGTITLAEWEDGKWKTMTNYVATKFVEEEGGDEGDEGDEGDDFAYAYLLGEYTESFDDSEYYGYPGKGTLRIAKSDNPAHHLQMTFFIGSYGEVTVYANVSSDGKTIVTEDSVSGPKLTSSTLNIDYLSIGRPIYGTVYFDEYELYDYTASRK